MSGGVMPELVLLITFGMESITAEILIPDSPGV